MSKVKVENKIKQFAKKNTGAMDRALNSMAVDIERLSKQQVPHRHGQLLSSGRHIKRGKLNWRVEYNKVYAAYQHRGMRADGTHVVRQYSKPGKKKHYLIDPAKTITNKAMDYIIREAERISVRI